MMGSGEECSSWCVFDGVKKIPKEPEALMAEINSAISALEYGRATAFLQNASFTSKNKSSDGKSTLLYDPKKADEAYKEGMAAMAAGKHDEAIHSLNFALSKCPPDKTSAVAKLQSLISITSQQLPKSSN
ncbi:hypothetical protein M9H77_25012 [Catharanthus roseus]|uniref:Uncharacterized protein n=1 Tax=Catharanthus roseus TaxID=4058 RepID=A0ACC0A7R0_CATRO|nr:hypothetical protein M9H77_25012 [Catharanthus roseus]